MSGAVPAGVVVEYVEPGGDVRTVVAGAVEAVQRFLAVSADDEDARLAVVTRGEMSDTPDPATSAVWGLLRSAQAEHPGRLVIVDVSADADADADAEDGPVFEVSDRRGSIRVAREGVRFRLDDQEAEFGWDEIGAVETTPARFGRRFTVTVHLSSRRWFNAEVEAASRSELKSWPAELDKALDAYFEE
ncbi:SpnB-like Rossmann fold domain-containing protein [Streptomyces albovinaceus]|uniref:SpnB-like Rossmann fold domain-containing protein n=1 Tax=Streptomyces albovinaceus TaxID=66867 RepID=UPI001FCA37D7|nr:hypothetical protein [Streptomyces albovinaceus]